MILVGGVRDSGVFQNTTCFGHCLPNPAVWKGVLTRKSPIMHQSFLRTFLSCFWGARTNKYSRVCDSGAFSKTPYFTNLTQNQLARKGVFCAKACNTHQIFSALTFGAREHLCSLCFWKRKENHAVMNAWFWNALKWLLDSCTFYSTKLRKALLLKSSQNASDSLRSRLRRSRSSLLLLLSEARAHMHVLVSAWFGSVVERLPASCTVCQTQLCKRCLA